MNNRRDEACLVRHHGMLKAAIQWRDRGFQITQTGITKACTENGAGFCIYIVGSHFSITR